VSTSNAETFNEAISKYLANNCNLLIQPDLSNADPEILKIGPNLASICGFMCEPDGMGGVSCVLPLRPDGITGGSINQHSADTTILRRLRNFREDTQEPNDQNTASLTGGGASADRQYTITPDFNIFTSIGLEKREKKLTAFEDGYESDISRLLLGGNYRVNDKAVIGSALNYFSVSGELEGGGDFDTDSYEGILYGSLTPLQNMYLEAVISYAKLNYDRTRLASHSFPMDGTDEVFSYGGAVSANLNGSKTGFYASFGYDYMIGNLNIGPQVGINWVSVKTDGYEETGGTGLELNVMKDSKKSLQGTLGIQALQAVNKKFGVLVPQVNISWIHEFKDDQREIDVRFAEDDRISPVIFSYTTEESDKNYGEASLSLSAIFPNAVTAFANLWMLFEHDQFDAYGASAGIRVEL
jgi:uncharacterized protein YhjY with autotransporter beta-barrel domain